MVLHCFAKKCRFALNQNPSGEGFSHIFIMQKITGGLL